MLTSAQQEPELGNWQLGIKYIGDNDATAFVISENGERAIEFYVHNTEMFEVEVSFEYELPFEGSADGPETEKIQAGDNETFTLNIENIDVLTFINKNFTYNSGTNSNFMNLKELKKLVEAY